MKDNELDFLEKQMTNEELQLYWWVGEVPECLLLEKVKLAYTKKYPHLSGLEENNKAFFDAAFRLIPPEGITPLELDSVIFQPTSSSRS